MGASRGDVAPSGRTGRGLGRGARRSSRRHTGGHGATISCETLVVGPYAVELTRKDIRRAWLHVDTPDGPLRVSAPASIASEHIEAFVLSRAEWIEQRRAELAGVEASPRVGHVMPDGRVLLWGEPHTLREVVALAIEARERALSDEAGQGAGASRRVRGPRFDPSDAQDCERVAASALRALLLERGRDCIAAWEPRMGVHADALRVHDARSRWGSCNVRTRSIMLALSLAHYPRECLELICVHELCHLIERGHDPRFRALMDRHLPDWREREALLRRLSQGR